MGRMGKVNEWGRGKGAGRKRRNVKDGDVKEAR